MHAIGGCNFRRLTEGEAGPLNPKLLKYGYLLTSKPSVAVLKAWSNVDPANFSMVEELLKCCIAHHVTFRLTIPGFCYPCLPETC